MLKLANRKRGIMSGTLPKFVDVHEKIIQVNLMIILPVKSSATWHAPRKCSNMNQMIAV